MSEQILTRSRCRDPLCQVRFRKPAKATPERLKLGMSAEFRKIGDEAHGSATARALDDGRRLVGGRHPGWHAVR